MTLIALIINLLWLFPLAACAAALPDFGLVFLVIAWTPLIVNAALIGAGEQAAPGS